MINLDKKELVYLLKMRVDNLYIQANNMEDAEFKHQIINITEILAELANQYTSHHITIKPKIF